MSSRIYDIADRYVQRLAALNPLAATAMGIPGYDDQMTDFSPAGFASLETLRRETLDELAGAPVTDDRDRIARDVMNESLRTQRTLFDAEEYRRGLAILNSPLQGIRSVFDQMPRETPEQWETIARRLALVSQGLAGLRETLRSGVERGVPAAARQVEACAAQCATWSGGGAGEGFFDTLVQAFDLVPGGSSALRADLERGAAAAATAYAELGRFLREDLLPHADPRDAVGPGRYALHARAFNGTVLDLDETYRWGWEELYGVEREMAETANRIAPGEPVAAVWELLETDPARSIDGVDRFREWMQELQDRTIAELDGTHFDIPEPVKRIEAMIAPPGGALAMYYTGPSEDFSRPGRTWYPTGGRTRFPLWGEVSIAYHEGVPGHHLERASVRYLAGELSRFQRLFGVSGYVEGWALYAERLMGELGYLDQPEYYLGMLRSQALRCVRVVVDIGMHLELKIPDREPFHGGETWTPELGQSFALGRSQFPPDFMASEITRYLGMPGQAISYKVGERAWLAARDTARRSARPDFDLKAFHGRALRLGPMGLDQMQRELGRL